MPESSSVDDFLSKIRQLTPQFQEQLSAPAPSFPGVELAALAECGALSAALPRAQGGLGFGTDPDMSGALLQLLKEIGRGNQVVGRIFEGHVNALLLIHQHGTPEQLREAASDVLEGNTIFGVWNTGPAGKPTMKRQENGTFLLCGGKTFATGAGRIERAIVTGQLGDNQWQMLLLRLDEIPYGIDFDSWHPLGMEASDSFTVDFTGIEVGPEALIGAPNLYYREPAFTGGAFRFSAIHLGGAEALVEFCRTYLKELHYQDDPHQLHRMGRMTVALETGRQWIAQAARWMDEDSGCARCLVTRAQMVRVAIGEICMNLIELVEVSVGARGLQGRRPLARMLRDLQMYLRQAGADSTLTAIGRAAFDET